MDPTENIAFLFSVSSSATFFCSRTEPSGASITVLSVDEIFRLGKAVEFCKKVLGVLVSNGNDLLFSIVLETSEKFKLETSFDEYPGPETRFAAWDVFAAKVIKA